jgi:hypothetical protein
MGIELVYLSEPAYQWRGAHFLLGGGIIAELVILFAVASVAMESRGMGRSGRRRPLGLSGRTLTPVARFIDLPI